MTSAPFTDACAPDRLRLGVVYDGAWFSRLWHWSRQSSPWQATLSFRGIHDLLRWHLHTARGIPLAAITVECADYILGRPDASTPPGMRSASDHWDEVLRRAGITRHDTRLTARGEIGANPILTRITLDQATRHDLDVVAIATGDSGFTPLVKQLRARGITALVPLIDVEFPDSRQGRLVTGKTLARTVGKTGPNWPGLLRSGLEPDYRLHYPFLDPAIGTPPLGGDDTLTRYGVVNRWDSTSRYGFVTDQHGHRWHLPSRALPDGTDHLPVGQTVTFTGLPRLQPGHHYPQIHRLHTYNPDTQTTSDNPTQHTQTPA